MLTSWPQWINASSTGFSTFVSEYHDPIVWIFSGALVIALIRLAFLVIHGFNVYFKRYRP